MQASPLPTSITCLFHEFTHESRELSYNPFNFESRPSLKIITFRCFKMPQCGERGVGDSRQYTGHYVVGTCQIYLVCYREQHLTEKTDKAR